jgi:hypothetical protein
MPNDTNISDALAKAFAALIDQKLETNFKPHTKGRASPWKPLVETNFVAINKAHSAHMKFEEIVDCLVVVYKIEVKTSTIRTQFQKVKKEREAVEKCVEGEQDNLAQAA